MLPYKLYVLGDSEGELRRLVDQSRLIGDLTEQVLRRAGIEPGMSVLDCGCGAGDVSFLVAKLVGPTGRIVGIDRSVAGVELARRRAGDAGLANVTFEVADLARLSTNGACRHPRWTIHSNVRCPTDNRYQPVSPARAPGLIVFKPVMSMSHIEPACTLTRECRRWIHETFRQTGVDIDMGLKLFSSFRRAGLPGPEIIFGSQPE